MGKKIVFFLFATLAAVPYACAAELISLGHVEVLEAYSDIKKGHPLLGQDLSGYYSPTVKFSDKLYLIPLYSVQFQRIRQYLPTEEGNKLYNTYFTNNFNLAMRYEFLPTWFVKLTALGTWNFVKESSEEAWGRGLYDYRDAGSSIELKHKVKADDYERSYTAGAQYYRRQYPNFLSLLSAASPTAAERREKDFDGYKYSLGLEQTADSGFGWYVKPYYLQKFYLDKHIVRDDGVLDDTKKRWDSVINLDGGVKVPLWAEKLFLNLDNNYTYNYSTMGYYDTRNTIPLNDDVYTRGYYSYHSFEVAPSLDLFVPVGEKKVARLNLGYSFLDRAYSHRKAQDENGGYTESAERDLEHTYSSALTWPLTKKIGLLTRFSYTIVRSNQKFEQFYKYSYDTYQVSSGLSLDF